MPAIYHEGSWLGNATDPEVLVKDTVGWTGKNFADNSKTKSMFGADVSVFSLNDNGGFSLSGSIQYLASFTPLSNLVVGEQYIASIKVVSSTNSDARLTLRNRTNQIQIQKIFGTTPGVYELPFTYQDGWYLSVICNFTATQSSMEIEEIMVRKAAITDPTYEPYHESVEEEIEQIYTDNGVLGAKNLLRLNAGQGIGTYNGLTVTNNYNSDGTIKNVVFNGTSTQSASGNFYQFAQRMNNNPIKLTPNTTYIFSIDNQNENVSLQVGYTKNNSYFMVKESPYGADSLMFVAPSDCEGAGWTIQLIKKTGSLVLNNWTVYPMLRLASDPDDTYQPYAMTNRELTDKVNALPREVFVTTDARTTTTNDANTLPCGFTRMNDANSNLPTDGTGGNVWYDILTVRQSNDSSDAGWGYGFQLAVQTTSNATFGDMYVRAVNGGATPTWSEWKKLN